ncbi:MAG: hypothetical protein KC466_02395, partial [Myxococcales bacterium]|nr:hypothetical protein [Myxococcales bacterium]
LTAGATSVYFDSTRDAPTTPEFRCLRGIAEDYRVYHSRKVSGSWTTPEQVVNGPNLLYTAWVDEEEEPIPACASCPDPDPDVCPIPCAPDSEKIGKPVYGGRQPAVTEDEKTMYFLGNGPYCRPNEPAIPADPGPPEVLEQWETLEINTGPCIYRTDRVGTSDPPEWGPATLVLKPAAGNPLPCQYDLTTETDPDIGKVLGLGEPSVTKDGRLLYFLYAKKLDTGKPLGDPPDCATSSPYSTPSVPGEPLCECVNAPDDNTAPTGCWLPACEILTNPTPGENCKQFCQDKHILGYDPDVPETHTPHECLPLSVLFCKDPQNSQDSAAEVDGVDVTGFGIGVARRDVWDPSIAVVEATQQ